MHQKNLWQETSREKIAFGNLKKSITTDLVVVGGGFTVVRQLYLQQRMDYQLLLLIKR